eukprot:6203162-Pleurochrysis_carterae.AAC.1
MTMPLAGDANLNGPASGDPTDLRFDHPSRASPTGLPILKLPRTLGRRSKLSDEVRPLVAFWVVLIDSVNKTNAGRKAAEGRCPQGCSSAFRRLQSCHEKAPLLQKPVNAASKHTSIPIPHRQQPCLALDAFTMLALLVYSEPLQPRAGCEF